MLEFTELNKKKKWKKQKKCENKQEIVLDGAKNLWHRT